MATHVFSTQAMLTYQKDTEKQINDQIAALNKVKQKLQAKLKDAYSRLTIAQNCDQYSAVAAIEAEIKQIESDIRAIDTQVNLLNDAIDETRMFIKTLIDEVEEADGHYSNLLKKTNDKIYNYISHMNSVMGEFESQVFLSASIGLQQLSNTFVSTIQETINAALGLNSEIVTTVINTFWDGLPKELQVQILTTDLLATDDGFVLCTKQMSDVFGGLGYKTINDGEKDRDVYNFFDDWYLFGIVNLNISVTTYSLLKMRERETDSYDNNDSGTAIPFVALDINALLDSTKIDNAVADIIYAGGRYDKVTVSTEIANYFSDPRSKGSYLLAEAYVNKIVQSEMNSDGVLTTKLVNGSNLENDRILSYLKDNPAIKFDEENQTVTILDPNNLSHEAKRAILAIRSGNVSYNAFAAENQYHAEYTLSFQPSAERHSNSSWTNLQVAKIDGTILTKIILDNNSTDAFQRAIVSEAGVSEKGTTESVPLLGGLVYPYIDLNSSIVKEQIEIHGEM